MLAYRSTDSEASSQEFIKVWKTAWAFFETSHAQTRKAVAQALESLAQCITLPMARTAVADAPDGKSPVRVAIAQITKALDSLAYASSIQELLHVVCSLILSLNVRLENGKSTLAAERLLLPLVQKIADLRIQKNFEHKEAADSLISTAMRVMGPAVVLEALPLNLEPQDRFVNISHLFAILTGLSCSQAGREPRAFLLPMLAQPHSSPLGHFVSYFVPLSERMFNLQNKAEDDGRQSEAKVWSVLISQVWVGFAGYCHAPPDVKNASTRISYLLMPFVLMPHRHSRPRSLNFYLNFCTHNLSYDSQYSGASNLWLKLVSLYHKLTPRIPLRPLLWGVPSLTKKRFKISVS